MAAAVETTPASTSDGGSPATWQRLKPFVLEGFVVSNYAVLSIDIWLAHSINRFRHPAEWIPLWFSIIAALLLATCFFFEIGKRHRSTTTPFGSGVARIAGLLVGGVSIAVGVAGLFFHLQSQFFLRFTIASLVYTAPFVAPLAYCGLGFLLLMGRMVPNRCAEWGQWVVFFALGGFAGNFVLTLTDHAQNGFFQRAEWIPVVSSALGVGFLLLALFEQENLFWGTCFAVMVLQAIVGVTGFALHLSANVNGLASSLYENFIHGAPLLAPLLFVNLALLAVIGLFDRWHHSSRYPVWSPSACPSGAGLPGS
ncbi:MAG: hypothetical protein IH849_06770 [Acidobacteria bacterium]|nr:hypothetical protein [Acidobacteriota bacterium]